MSDVLLETVFGNKLKEKYTLEQAIGILKEHDLIAVGELAELAISKLSGVAQCDKNAPNIDLVSGMQIKHGQTNPDNPQNGCLKAWISIKNTTAPILAVVTERLTSRQYFFHFPYDSFKHMNANAFSIPFELNGNPRKRNDWWNYEVDNFSKLCKIAKS